MIVKIKLLRQEAVMPKKATPLSVGYDLYTCEDFLVEQKRVVIPLGFALEMPEGVEAKIEPRSGFSSRGIEGYFVTNYDCKGGFRSLNRERFSADVLVGKIDPDYTGEVSVIIKREFGCRDFIIPAGTRIAQMTFYKTYAPDFELTDTLTETERGDGGFGSTGTN